MKTDEGAWTVAYSVLSEEHMMERKDFEELVEQAMRSDNAIEAIASGVLSKPKGLRFKKSKEWALRVKETSPEFFYSFVLLNPESMKWPEWEAWFREFHKAAPIPGVRAYLLDNEAVVKHPNFERVMNALFSEKTKPEFPALEILNHPEIINHPAWESWVEQVIRNGSPEGRVRLNDEVLGNYTAMLAPSWNRLMELSVSAGGENWHRPLIRAATNLEKTDWIRMVRKEMPNPSSAYGTSEILSNEFILKTQEWLPLANEFIDTRLQNPQNGAAKELVDGFLSKPEVILSPEWERWMGRTIQQLKHGDMAVMGKVFERPESLQATPKCQEWLERVVRKYPKLRSEWESVVKKNHWQGLYAPLLNGKAPTAENIMEYILNK